MDNQDYDLDSTKRMDIFTHLKEDLIYVKEWLCALLFRDRSFAIYALNLSDDVFLEQNPLELIMLE
jgi:hypothetical protein